MHHLPLAKGGGLEKKNDFGGQISKVKNNNYICHAPYHRNCIAYDHDFWYTCQGLFQQFIACDNRTQSPALFQNIFKFCTFLPKFSNIFPFLTIFFPLFLKNCTHALTFQNRPCLCKMISANVFVVFLQFLGCQEGRRAKNSPE